MIYVIFLIYLNLQIVEGHTGPIINIKVLEPFKTKLKVVDDSLYLKYSFFKVCDCKFR